MNISAQNIADVIRGFRHVDFELTDAYMECMAANLINAQTAQKSAYEFGWNEKLAKIDKLVGEGKDFGAIVRAMIQPSHSNTLFEPAVSHNDFKYDLVDFHNTPGKTLCAYDGKYRLVDEKYIDFRFIDCLTECLTRDIDTVVEFGAGWGKILSLLLMSSGRSNVNYMACEPSESGRHSFARLFGMVDGLDFSSHPFDFYAPDFSMLKGKKHVLAITCAAIEQIAFLPRSFLDGILKAAENVTIVFYEPVGWQRSLEQINLAIKSVVEEFGGQIPITKWYGKNFVYKIHDDNFIENSAAWSISGKYNINLLNSINTVVEERRAQIVHQQYDVYSANPLNPYSLIVLKKIN